MNPDKSALNERRAALLEAAGKFNEKCGHDVITSGSASKTYDVIPTGFTSLDKLLGIKGYPKGLVTEIFGPEDTKKTSLAFKAITAVQKKGGIAVFLDCSLSYNEQLAKDLGVNTTDLILIEPKTPEQAFQAAEILLEAKSADLLVVDGFGALRSQAVSGVTSGTNKTKTSLLASFIRNLAAWAAQTPTAIVITRRMNPNRDMVAAANEVIEKNCSVRIEMIYVSDKKSQAKLHKNVGSRDPLPVAKMLDIIWE